MAQLCEGSSAWPQIGEGRAATYDNPLASSSGRTLSEVMLLLLSESDLDPSSKALGSLLVSLASSEIFSMVGRWWWLRVKDCNSLEPASHGFFSGGTKAAALRCWLLIPKGAWPWSWWEGDTDVDYMPHLALGTHESLISGGSSVPLVIAPPHAGTRPGLSAPPSLALSALGQVNCVTGRKKTPLDWRFWCLDVGPGSGLVYLW